MENIRIGTAQNVDLLYEVAPFGDRLVAYLLDTLILIAWMVAVLLIVGFSGLNVYTSIVLLFLPMWCYSLFCELLMNGQSVGKRVAKVRVVWAAGTVRSRVSAPDPPNVS